MEKREQTISLIATIGIAILIFTISSMILGPSPEKIANLRSIVYHFTIFFFLSFFTLITLVQHKKITFFIPAILITIIYAVTDELHQSLVPYRDASFFDFMINTTGVATAAIVYGIILIIKNGRRR